MVQKIGHRGAKGYIPENTLESFQKALDLGVDGIELDVHVCASGELVVFHDFTVDRVTNGSGEVDKLTLSELKTLKIAGELQIPTLAEVFDLINRKCWINVELKGHDTAQPTCELIEKYVTKKGWTYEDFIVSSFQKDELEKTRAHNPKIRLATLSQASVEQALEWADELSAYAIHPHFSLLTDDNIHEAKKKGYKINVWTVNHYEDIQRLEAHIIDGIISDFPDRL
ncbi:glycerophosphoryl diester phosphodiesterase family protein [Flavobacterium limnosediminis JC2902]|uniref:Glycerophosphoryl diester phosphodiesterase family protein n=1 Tax=Flavobacterium limnosediminis JC2902 TaxID=1341181 RepID=V6SU33_9FLAO|nr:glycerophosphodiester phosphodiesterase family protein [Flavobacterium limnosediminis]ESU29672.1 glycerophosphoryl diester phosphodiesterase family protein [Flavobacterium limnosediminis JC2902]